MRRALLVGINDYPGAPLAGCVNDAEAMHSLLSKNSDGSPNFECRLLTGPPLDVTRTVLRKQIDQLFAQEADVALLYFSGHGTENNLGGYLVTPDIEAYDEGVAMTEVLTRAGQSRAKEVVIILDCCHSGSLGEVPAIGSANAEAVLREGLSILTASRSTEASLERGGQGLFTSLVRAALDGGAADVVGKVTVASIYAYVDQSLGAWEQRPLIKTHVSKLTSLRQCAPMVDLETLRLLPRWFETVDAHYPLDPSYEPAPHGVLKSPDDQNEGNELIFRCFQRLRDAKLLVPVGEEHLYYAAMHSTACRLTPLGTHYWRLANEGRL